MAATAPAVLILVDDSALNYNSVPGSSIWTPAGSSHFIDSKSSWADGSINTGPFASCSYTFQGTGILFYGNTPGSQFSQTFSVTIDWDENGRYNSAYPAPQEYRLWYTSPTLTDATHTIVIGDMVSINLDYVIIVAGESTPLAGRRLLVDDADPEMIYEGAWNVNTDGFDTAHGYPPGVPFGNATHESRTVGDSVTFRFAGTSIGVRGIFHWNATGVVGASFTLDGNVTALTFGSSTHPPFLDQPNYEFFNATGLEPGNHTLVVSITDVTGTQSLLLDYILYEPSFDSLASKPNFANADSVSTSPASGVYQGSSATGLQMSGISPTSVGEMSPSSGSRSNRIGQIVGGVLGAVVLLIIVGIFLRLRTLHRRRKETTPEAVPEFYSEKIPIESLNTVPGLTFSANPSGLSSQNQEQIRARLEEVQALTAQLERESALARHDHDREQITALQNRINRLLQENMHLTMGCSGAPPAYDDSEQDSVTHGHVAAVSRTVTMHDDSRAPSANGGDGTDSHVGAAARVTPHAKLSPKRRPTSGQ